MHVNLTYAQKFGILFLCDHNGILPGIFIAA